MRFLLNIIIIVLLIIGAVHVNNIEAEYEQHKAEVNQHMESIDRWLIELEREINTPVVEEAPPADVPDIYVGDIDLELIARVVAAEARGESMEGQMAVAQTIYDRADLWGKTPEEIVLAPSQFAKPYKGEIPQTTWDAVEAVFIYGKRVFSEPVTHFYAYEICSPKWAESKVSRGKIGGHEFMF